MPICRYPAKKINCVYYFAIVVWLWPYFKPWLPGHRGLYLYKYVCACKTLYKAIFTWLSLPHNWFEWRISVLDENKANWRVTAMIFSFLFCAFSGFYRSTTKGSKTLLPLVKYPSSYRQLNLYTAEHFSLRPRFSIAVGGNWVLSCVQLMLLGLCSWQKYVRQEYQNGLGVTRSRTTWTITRGVCWFPNTWYSLDILPWNETIDWITIGR